MHGTVEKRAKKLAGAKASTRLAGARRPVEVRPIKAVKEQPLLLKISLRLNRALTKLEANYRLFGKSRRDLQRSSPTWRGTDRQSQRAVALSDWRLSFVASRTAR